jgi:hypothetical protein
MELPSMNRHLLSLALAAASLAAAPLAFAQSAPATPPADPQQADPQQAEPQQAEPQQETPATPATTMNPTDDSARKISWSDLDTDHDGKLSKTEAAPVESLSQAFDTADSDQDGALTADEYKAYLASRQDSPAPTTPPSL